MNTRQFSTVIALCTTAFLHSYDPELKLEEIEDDASEVLIVGHIEPGSKKKLSLLYAEHRKISKQASRPCPIDIDNFIAMLTAKIKALYRPDETAHRPTYTKQAPTPVEISCVPMAEPQRATVVQLRNAGLTQEEIEEAFEAEHEREQQVSTARKRTSRPSVKQRAHILEKNLFCAPPPKPPCTWTTKRFDRPPPPARSRRTRWGDDKYNPLEISSDTEEENLDKID